MVKAVTPRNFKN